MSFENDLMSKNPRTELLEKAVEKNNFVDWYAFFGLNFIPHEVMFSMTDLNNALGKKLFAAKTEEDKNFARLGYVILFNDKLRTFYNFTYDSHFFSQPNLNSASNYRSA